MSSAYRLIPKIKTGGRLTVLQRRQPATRVRPRWANKLWLLCAVVVALVAATTVRAQVEPLTVELAGFSADDPSAAQAVVTVLDEDGRPIADLTGAQFQVQLDGSAVPVTAVSQGVDGSLGIAVVLALDVSNSMGDALEQAKTAALRFLDGLGPEDNVAVVAFARTVDVRQGFTQDRAAAGAAIEGLTVSTVGGTALYQATADSVRLAADSGNSRRAVVLLSDGMDVDSPIPPAEVLSTAESLGVPVFTIGLGADVDADYLQELAQVSGGEFAATPSPEGLDDLYQAAGELLRGQYILSLDTAGLALEAGATLQVEVTAGERTGSGARAICLQRTCVILSDITSGERLDAVRTIVAQVISADAVVSVTFLVDGEPVAELSEPPYQFTFDPAAFAEGEHTLEAKATTAAEETVTANVTVRIGGESGSGMITVLLAGAVFLVVTLVAMLMVLRLRRHRSGGGEERPAPVIPRVPEGPVEPAEPKAPRQLWEERPPALPPAPKEPLGRLQVVSGPQAGQTFPVAAAPISIGSGHRCLIRLPEEESGEEIAPEEARVWIRDSQLMVHALTHLTPTGAVGGGWSILDPGEVFTIGPCTFKFELDGQDAPERTDEPEASAEVPDILRSEQESPPAPSGVRSSGYPEAFLRSAPSTPEDETAQDADADDSASSYPQPEA